MFSHTSLLSIGVTILAIGGGLILFRKQTIYRTFSWLIK
nr:MAG TPA: hypothetical protein [Bacteriophage sp.]DAN23334.1 MAG TPA_asm: hypothetical protein [Bacteriophage sp.]